jgi:hypothetical protein
VRRAEKVIGPCYRARKHSLTNLDKGLAWCGDDKQTRPTEYDGVQRKSKKSITNVDDFEQALLLLNAFLGKAKKDLARRRRGHEHGCS